MDAVRKGLSALGIFAPAGVAVYKILAYYSIYFLMMLGLHKLFPFLVTWSHRITNSFLTDLPKVTRNEPQWVPIAEIDAKDLNMEEFHEKYLKKNIPVVLRGLGVYPSTPRFVSDVCFHTFACCINTGKTKGWTAYGQWNLEVSSFFFFCLLYCADFGDLPKLVSHSPACRHASLSRSVLQEQVPRG